MEKYPPFAVLDTCASYAMRSLGRKVCMEILRLSSASSTLYCSCFSGGTAAYMSPCSLSRGRSVLGVPGESATQSQASARTGSASIVDK